MVVGPVLYLDLLLGSRRNRQFLFRYIYAAWLLLQFGWLYLVYYIGVMVASSPGGAFWSGPVDPNETFRFASEYITLFIWQQLVLLMLATPAMTAGAITDEKERGTLQYLLSAGLTSVEIVVGKLIARMIMVLNVFAAGWPLLFFVAVFSGLDARILLAIMLQAIIATFALASASILASVWAKQTRDAVLQLYAVGAIFFGVFVTAAYVARTFAAPPGVSPPWWLDVAEQVAVIGRAFDPAYALQPGWTGDTADELGMRLLWHLVAWGSIGVVCLILASWRMRAAYFKQMEGAGKKKQLLIWHARPKVTAEPLRWKERFVVGLAPLPWLRFIPSYAAMTAIALAAVFGVILMGSAATVPGNQNQAWVFDLSSINPTLATIDATIVQQQLDTVCPILVLLASLIVGIRCSGAITGEREKNTWEALLLTPLETPQLVRAKLWGVIGATYPYIACYAIPLGIYSFFGGPLVVFSFIISLGTTWLAMFYVGATGLWCSARSKSSWRSLIGVLGWGYLGGFIFNVALLPVLGIVFFVMWLFLAILEQVLVGTSTIINGGPFGWQVFLVSGYVTAAISFLIGSWFFLKEAEKRVADYDRTRHWQNEPKRRPREKPRQVREFEEAERESPAI